MININAQNTNPQSHGHDYLKAHCEYIFLSFHEHGQSPILGGSNANISSVDTGEPLA